MEISTRVAIIMLIRMSLIWDYGVNIGFIRQTLILDNGFTVKKEKDKSKVLAPLGKLFSHLNTFLTRSFFMVFFFFLVLQFLRCWAGRFADTG